jgi:hypothetical protein
MRVKCDEIPEPADGVITPHLTFDLWQRIRFLGGWLDLCVWRRRVRGIT